MRCAAHNVRQSFQHRRNGIQYQYGRENATSQQRNDHGYKHQPFTHRQGMKVLMFRAPRPEKKPFYRP